MPNSFTFWWNNARPISLPQSLLPALTAVALSVGNQEFNVFTAIAAVVGVIFLHLSLNLLDDWFDYNEGSAEARQKVASEGFRGRMVKYPYLTSGEATHSELLKASLCFLLFAAVMGGFVIAFRGWNILFFGLLQDSFWAFLIPAARSNSVSEDLVKWSSS